MYMYFAPPTPWPEAKRQLDPVHMHHPPDVAGLGGPKKQSAQ
jgi:hypothetical protein